MTADTRLTVDDIRHHAEEVRAVAQERMRRLAQDDTAKIFIIGAIAIFGAISVAYYLGSRAARGYCVE